MTTYVGYTGHPRVLEFAAIESLYSLAQVRSSLKLDEAC